ncbi:MAG: proline-rich domain-containing protein [Planctomycetaceae bacterium]
MDGSRGAKNTPKPQAGPQKNRPGAKPVVPPPAKSSTSGPPSTPTGKPPGSTSASPARPASGSRTTVDEDDPFGIGNSSAAASAIQATEKPDKSRLHKVVCPMCEQVGFVPKSAIGKNIRCANEKCMVPVFKATESGGKTAERKPARLSAEAASVTKAAEAALPKKRNPIVVYAVAGGVLLVLVSGLLTVLNRKQDDPSLREKIVIPSDPNVESPEEEEARLAAEAAAAAKAAESLPDPKADVAAMAKQMIVLARQPNIRDKAWSRRMTADLYLQSDEPTLAAQELNQLLAVDRSKSFYRIEPHVTQYWQRMASADKDAARRSLELALAERDGIPKSGRAGAEAALSLAAVLVAEGKVAEARALVDSRRVDTSITANRDMLTSVAWFWIADHSRENVIPVPSATDIMVWTDPLHTVVACDLALHQRWTEAISWSLAGQSAAVVSASLTEVATIAGAASAPPIVFQQLIEAIPPGKPEIDVRVRAAVAAATHRPSGLDEAIAAVDKLSAPMPLKIPTTQQIAEKYSSEREEELHRAVAVAEVVRAAIICGSPEKARSLMVRLRAELDAAAPPTRAVRVLALEVSGKDESAARQRIANDLKTTNSSVIDRTFTEYRRHLINNGNPSGLYVITEDRRLRAVQLLSRIIRAGGAAMVQEALQDPSSGWSDEVMLDDLSGLLAVAALQSNQTPPVPIPSDPSWKMDTIAAGHASLVAKIAPVLMAAWMTRASQPAAGLKALESDCGNELPGLRQAYVNELVASLARTTDDVGVVLKAIGTLRNGVWREEAFLIAGRQFASRNFEENVKKWIVGNRMPALEQISLTYGMAQVMIDRISAAAVAAPEK